MVRQTHPARHIALLTYIFLSAAAFVGLTTKVSAQEPTITGCPKALSGSKVTCTVEVPAGAPEGGLLVELRSDDLGVAKVEEPRSKQLKQGEKSLTFNVIAENLAEPKETQIKAVVSGGGNEQVSKDYKLRVHPLVRVSPQEISGVGAAEGTIELLQKAPSTGAVFNITFDPPQATLDPAQQTQVTVRPDKEEAKFKIFTKPVTANTNVKITVTGEDISRTTVLRLKYDWRRFAAAVSVGLVTLFIAFIVLPYIWRLLKPLRPTEGAARAARRLNDGEDGLPSTSIFQNYLWTAVVLFAYSSLAFIKLWWLGGSANDLKITRNLIIVMGASITTRVLARAITTSKVRDGRVVKLSPLRAETYLERKGENRLTRFKYIFTDDAGNPDLNKIQVMAWTFIAVGIFLIGWHSNVMLKSAVDMNLPEIDDALVVLMGLAAGGYLGNKLIRVERPLLFDAVPPKPQPGTTFLINGEGFTTTKGDIVVDDKVSSTWVADPWADKSIKVKVPADAPKKKHSIRVIANNQLSANALEIEII